MLQTNDIGVLFATMEAAYGRQWTHGAEAIPVWQSKLAGFSPQQIMTAASEAIDRHPNFPPSIGQLIGLLRAGKPRANTYLPAPPYDKSNADKAWSDMEKLAGRKLRPSDA